MLFEMFHCSVSSVLVLFLVHSSPDQVKAGVNSRAVCAPAL